MWSASQKYGLFQPSAFTAASAAARVEVGSEPMMLCSRFDLFHTGMTSIPAFAASTHACSCAFAWWAKRSPTPMEYLPRVRVMISSVRKTIAVRPQPKAGVRHIENLFAIHKVEAVLQLRGIVAALHLVQIGVAEADALHFFARQMARAPRDP